MCHSYIPSLNSFHCIFPFLQTKNELIFLYNLVQTIRGKAGPKATAQVWEGAEGLEWTLSSPPPYHSFNTPPVVK